MGERVTDELMIVLEGERAPSWNGMYAGMHWAKRSRLARDIHLKVREALDALPFVVEPFDVQVDICLIAAYRKDTPDSDNVVDKPYIDGLKGRVLREDNARWVRWAASRAVAADHDSVTIVVRPVEAEE